MMMSSELSRQLAVKMNSLISTGNIDLDTQYKMYDVFRTTDATSIDDYPDWMRKLLQDEVTVGDQSSDSDRSISPAIA